ncbi:dTDP-4-dehydrorhamnose 3,5-epimerase [Roseobacter sp. HKCCA0434]|uniref:dTDP-4-dehydrorhamnose 3,5-epimerase n=1 Tax=Roseobacter sp. HKCCA0434 TaxID=3079297 RepID=UPI002905E5CA|nr:dTDP-4-dehydrorhamnose 3,5-epimerase [Roseobacter sp. HKCCA0434]
MQIDPLPLPGLARLTPRRHGDARGWFAEVFRDDLFRAQVADVTFVQENRSLSAKAGTLRGLHFQTPPRAQGKLISCLAGSLWDVAVDLRRSSETYGQWYGEELSAENGRQLWIPAGFAHGFCTLKPDTVIGYKCTDTYAPDHDAGIAWDSAGIDWPDRADPDTLSGKDRAQPSLSELGEVFA